MADTTEDGRYIVVDGRRWRAADPNLPPPTKDLLVSELMSARRAVRAALASRDGRAESDARARVQDAKVALGERGVPWWEAGPDVEPRAGAIRRALRRAESSDD